MSFVEKFCTRYPSLEALDRDSFRETLAKHRTDNSFSRSRNFKNRDLEFRCTKLSSSSVGSCRESNGSPSVVDSVGKIDPRYRSKRRAAEPAVGWPISCQSNWLAGRVPGHGRGGGEPCARLALPAPYVHTRVETRLGARVSV